MARGAPGDSAAPRTCAQCGTRLRRGNSALLCDPCQRSSHTMDLLAPMLPLEFWQEADMRRALAAHDLGAVSRLYRTRTPIRRQHMIAELVGFSQAHISRIERGLCEIKLDTVLRFVQGLRIPPYLVDPVGAGQYLDGLGQVGPAVTVPAQRELEVGDQMRRRDLLKGLTGAATLVGFTLAGDEDDDPLIAEDFGRIGAAHAAQLEGVPAHLYQLDFRYGGDTLCDQAAAQLRRAHRLLNRGTYTDRIGRRLQVAAGELGLCAGWLAFDAGRQGQARYCYTEALAAARVANDPGIEVRALAVMSMQAVALDRPREGLYLAQAAQRTARDFATPTVEALLAMREARAWGKLRDAPSAEAAMLRARRAFERRGEEDDRPIWLSFFDEAELSGNEGTCQLDLGNPARATTLLEAAYAQQQDGMVRNRSLYTVRLARANLARRDVNRACQLAEEALELVANEVTSTRTLGELRDFRGTLARHQSTAASRAFASRFDSTVVT